MGMKLEDLTNGYDIVKEDAASGVKEVKFKPEEWQKIGYYSLQNVNAQFFQDHLFRIDIKFQQNADKIFAAFDKRFGQLHDNDSWTRGDQKLKAKSATKAKLFGAILAPEGFQWDAIVLFDVDLWNQAEAFKKDAPNRTAKDF